MRSSSLLIHQHHATNTNLVLLLVVLVALCLSPPQTAAAFCPVHASRPPILGKYTATPSTTTTTFLLTALGTPICEYHTVDIPAAATGQQQPPGPPTQQISVQDLTPYISQLLLESNMQQGFVNVISRHTTTAISINESESRLSRDMQELFLKLAPPDERSEPAVAVAGTRYYHNDIDKRPESKEEAERCRENGWDIDDAERLQAWRDQEPINAHSHLISMLLGSSESIPVVDGNMVIGQWQSVLLVDLDGPRDRTVGVQFMGYQ